MFVVISGTNRRGSNTARIAARCVAELEVTGVGVELLDLQELPSDVLDPDAYFQKPASFAPFQAALDRAEGVVTVVPEYNGSFPGVLKLFVDMIEFPRTLQDVPAAFVGLSAGRWGGIRSVEQLEQVFSYRNARLYNRRTFIPGVHEAFDDAGALLPELSARLSEQLQGFVRFAQQNPLERGA